MQPRHKPNYIFVPFAAPLLKSKVFGMDFLLQTSKQISSEQCRETGLYVEAILRNLCKSCGQEVVSDMWKEGQLAWDMFLPDNSIDSFIHEHVSKTGILSASVNQNMGQTKVSAPVLTISDLNIIIQYFQKLEYTGKEANSSAIDDIIKYLQNSKPAENNGIQDLINVSSLKSQQMAFS